MKTLNRGKCSASKIGLVLAGVLLTISGTGVWGVTINTSSSPPNGGSASGAGVYILGSDVTVCATADLCYSFVDWTADGTVVSASNCYTFIAASNETLVANFAPNEAPTISSLTNLYFFAGSPADGSEPYAGLVQGSDGNFYGTTAYGGTGNSGTVFRISPSGNYTSFYWFAGSPADGAYPYAGLVQGSDSNFYGTTYEGGTHGYGTVFQISPSGNYTSLYSFAGSPTDGANPYAGLAQGSDSNFYGTTVSGGAHGFGTVFRISPSGNYTSFYSFAGSPADGTGPFGGLVQGSDSNFYGTTYYGGTGNYGTVFRISPSGSETILYSFAGPPADGSNPYAGLVQGSDSNLYGTTLAGGTGNSGTVFRISPSGNYTSLYSFAGSPTDGSEPYAGLALGSDGNFYGTTANGVTNGFGTAFQISPDGCETILYSFAGPPADGSNPYAGLVQGSDSNFYGTTYIGGPYASGAMFKLDVGLGALSNSCTFSLGSTNAEFGAAGGSDSVSVTASNGCTWTATSNAGFITITSGTNGTGNGMVSYSVAANTSTNALTGTMTIAGQIFTVNQFGAPVNYSITTSSSPSGGGTTSGGGTFTSGSAVTVTATPASCYTFANWTTNGMVASTSASYSFTATASEALVANFSLISDTISTSSSPSAGGTTSGGGTYGCGSPVTVTATPVPGYIFADWTTNGTVASTSASYSFTATASEMLVANFTCVFTLSSTSTNMDAGGGSGSVGVATGGGCPWTATNNVGWITITSGSSGTGNGTVHYSVAANTSTNELTGTMTIAGQTFTVNSTVPPTVICPADVTTTTDPGQCSASSVVLGTATATGNVAIASIVNNAPAQFPKGTNTVLWTATDISGNTATATQTVTVVDAEPPTVTAPANVIVSIIAGKNYATDVALGSPVTADNCGVASVTNNAPTQFPVGTNTVTWTVTDTSGNTASAVQTVTVIGPSADLTGRWVATKFGCFTNGSYTGRCYILGYFEAVNQGTAPSVRCQINYYRSTNSVFDAGATLILTKPLRRLAPGQSTRQLFGTRLAPGDNPTGEHLIAVIDPNDVVVESTKTNNVVVDGPLQ